MKLKPEAPPLPTPAYLRRYAFECVPLHVAAELAAERDLAMKYLGALVDMTINDIAAKHGWKFSADFRRALFEAKAHLEETARKRRALTNP